MITTILLDDGGVMNDNSIRGPQWQELISQYFTPRFGGTADEWAEANVKAMEEVMDEIDQLYVEEIVQVPKDYYKQQNEQWIITMFNEVGLPIPEDRDLNTLAVQAAKWITPRVNSSYTGMIEIIHQLGQMYELYTASNETSYDLQGYLKGMGVDYLFQQYFGPDILGAFKTSPYYYKEISRQTGIDPSNAVVIDDKVVNLKFAQDAGYHVIHSCLDGGKPEVDIPFFTTPSQIESLLLDLEL